MDTGNFDSAILQGQVSPLSQTFSAVDFIAKLLGNYIWKEIIGKSHVPCLGPQLMGKRGELCDGTEWEGGARSALGICWNLIELWPSHRT